MLPDHPGLSLHQTLRHPSDKIDSNRSHNYLWYRSRCLCQIYKCHRRNVLQGNHCPDHHPGCHRRRQKYYYRGRHIESHLHHTPSDIQNRLSPSKCHCLAFPLYRLKRHIPAPLIALPLVPYCPQIETDPLCRRLGETNS
ncbi:MAG: hypothetical protein BWY95_00758 [Bacteroidetes bacterium ADurb.BinA104]|nr:MAG: hypothetical protein BWY95_00758 [Bacteroidetes bacterium ADurb.BinA104]